MEWYYILIIIIGLILLFIITSSLYLVITTINPKRFSREETKKLWKEYRFQSEYDSSIRHDIIFEMDDGYIIHGDYILKKGANTFVICCHGYTVNREAEIEYALMFNKLGYNVILYDQRGHGDNKKTKTTLGYIEAKDLSSIMDQVYKRFGKDIKIALHGVSMGAATALLVTKYRQDIEWIIADCGFVNFNKVMRYQIHKRHMPGFIFTPVASFLCKVIYGFSFNDNSVLKYIKNIKVPVLIFHGQKDTFVPVDNAYILYDLLTSKKRLVIYPNTKHADCLSDDKEKYEKEVIDFIKETHNVS